MSGAWAGHLPRGTLVSPSRLAILQYLQMHGPCTTAQLADALGHLASWAGISGTTPAIVAPWLRSNLGHLRAQGHVCRHITEAGESAYIAGTESVAVPNPLADPEERAQIAAPRHINVMHGPTYQPAAWAPARPGAQAHAAVPSRMGTRLVRYRGAA